MIKNTQVARNHLVLQDGTVWNIDSLTFVGNYDNGTGQCHTGAKVDIATHRKVIKFKHVRNSLEALLILINLTKVLAQLNKWCGSKLPAIGKMKALVTAGDEDRFDTLTSSGS